MKHSFSSLLFLLCCSLVHSQDLNVDQKNCLHEGGHLRSLSWTHPRPGASDFCYFWNEQGIDARTLRLGKFTPLGPEANRSYRLTLDYTVGACIRRSGQPVQAIDQDRRSHLICLFWDGSAIDHRTLENGVRSPWNRELNRALGIF